MCCVFLCACESQNDVVETDSRDDLYASYEKAKTLAIKRNMKFLKKYICKQSRSMQNDSINATNNIKVIDYLVSLEPDALDSLLYDIQEVSSTQENRHFVDSIYGQAVLQFELKYGENTYDEMSDYFEYEYIPGDFSTTIDFVSGMDPELAKIYMEISGNIDGSMSTYDYYMSYGEWECYRGLVSSVGIHKTEALLACCSSELLTAVGLPEITLAGDAVAILGDLVEDLISVHQYNDCIRRAQGR